MLCPACGAENPGTADRCSRCDSVLTDCAGYPASALPAEGLAGGTVIVQPHAPPDGAFTLPETVISTVPRRRGRHQAAQVTCVRSRRRPVGDRQPVRPSLPHPRSCLASAAWGPSTRRGIRSSAITVALKVVRPEVAADPDAARQMEQRFKRELLLARQVTHKNVVRIHDLGEIDGIKYITMSFIEGEDSRDDSAARGPPARRSRSSHHAHGAFRGSWRLIRPAWSIAT